MSDTFCVLPWLGASSITNGVYRPCCIYQPKDTTNLWKDTLDNNIQQLAPLRKALLNGEKPDECSRCWYLEQVGSTSVRQSSNQDYDHLKDYILENTDENGNTDVIPIYFDMKLSNLCNLGCRMCTPSISSVLDAEVKKNPNYEWDKWNSAPWFDIGWDDVALSKIKELSPQKMKFTGGEPFANPNIFEFLESFDNKKDMDLEFITNGLLLNSKFFKLFDKFKSIKISVSCDGVGEVYDYIRWPGKWTKFDKKMTQIKSSIEDLSVVAIISAYNVRNIPDMVEYFSDCQFHMQPLETPPYMHPWVEGDLLPSFLNIDHHCDIINIKNAYRKYDKDLHEQFITQTKIRDEIRKQDFWKMIGEGNE